jgi:hypothetical protein
MGYPPLTKFQRAYILEQFYGKGGLRQISFNFRNNFNLPLSPPTLLRRIIDNVKIISETIDILIKNEYVANKKSMFRPNLGNIWEIDETPVKIGKEFYPLIVVKDLKTCYFVAASIEKSSTIETTTKTLISSKNLARKCPVEIRGDGNTVYEKAVKRAFNGKTKLTINKKIGQMGQDQSIEGTFGGSIKSWIKSKRSLHSWSIAPIILKGYFLNYHFARPCEALCGRTPAEVAMEWNPIDKRSGWQTLLGLTEYYRKILPLKSDYMNSIPIPGQTYINVPDSWNSNRIKENQSNIINKQLKLNSFGV